MSDTPPELVDHLGKVMPVIASKAGRELVALAALDALAEWADGGLIDPSNWTVVDAKPTGWDWCSRANKPLSTKRYIDPCEHDAPMVVLSPRGGEL